MRNDGKISRRVFLKKGFWAFLISRFSSFNLLSIFPEKRIIIPRNFWKRLYASFFGMMEVPLLTEFMKIREEKGEKYAFEKLEEMAKNGEWSTRVVPVKEAIRNDVKILPIEEIREIVKRSKVRGIGECWCRTNFKNCNKSTKTCIALSFAEDRIDLMDRKFSSKVSEEEIDKLLDRAEEEGLVHQLICAGDKDVFYVICNCCPCCCVGLQAFIKYGKHLVQKSDFVAETDTELCIGCGRCLERCYFSARERDGKIVRTIKNKCFGCGLCAGKCPVSAIKLVRVK